MNIWSIIQNEDYNEAYLIDENGEQCYEDGMVFTEIQSAPFTREIRIETRRKGFPDIMNYWGFPGTFIVSAKAKAIIETYFAELSLQFFPCHCSKYPEVQMWILNLCEYHDVLDVPNCECRFMKNQEGKEVIKYIRKYSFTKKAFDLDMFKFVLPHRKDVFSLFVSDRFKTVMEENGVTGLALEKVYSI